MRSEKLDIKTLIGITGAYVAYMMGSGFSTGSGDTSILRLLRHGGACSAYSFAWAF